MNGIKAGVRSQNSGDRRKTEKEKQVFPPAPGFWLLNQFPIHSPEQ
jgi:hypothetical protein